MFFQDPRDYQIGALSLLLALGLFLKDWTLEPLVVLSAVLTCLVVQSLASLLLEWRQSGTLSWEWTTSLRSALITSLSLSLLLRTDHWFTMIFVATVAILSKFVVRVRNKHLFNPANAGIIAALVVSQDAWVSPGQWGELGWEALLFIGVGGLVLQRVGRWDTSVVFLGTYSGLMFVRDCWLGWSGDVFVHHLSSGSLLLFALFMITDPRSIPDARWSRIVWAAMVGVVTFLLQTGLSLPIAVFWSLFLLAPLTPLLDVIASTDRFTWASESKLNLNRV
jgi:Na+-transporting NADH:ubiquinone oxidoreductase subunit NqrB